jgi:hypothetical protein
MKEARSGEVLMAPEPRLDRKVSLENFKQTWAEQSGFTVEQLDLIWNHAEQQYTNLPFHNFEHACETLFAAMDLADFCEKNGVRINRRVLIAGSLFHDAGFQDDEKTFGCESKEEHSASIFEGFAPEYGFEDETGLVKSTIMSTDSGATPQTLEDKILVRADLINVCAGFPYFISKTGLLWEERKVLNEGQRTPIDFLKFVVDNIRILDKYFSNDLSLGNFDSPVWSNNAFENVAALATKGAKEFGFGVEDLGGNILERLRKIELSKRLSKLIFKDDQTSS